MGCGGSKAAKKAVLEPASRSQDEDEAERLLDQSYATPGMGKLLDEIIEKVAGIRGKAEEYRSQVQTQVVEIEQSRLESVGSTVTQNGVVTASYAPDDESAQTLMKAQEGEPLEIIVRDAGGWAYCRKKDSSLGWLPSNRVAELCALIADHDAQGSEGLLTVKKGDTVEVMSRHYSGWAFCREWTGPNLPGVAAQRREGWVTDAYLEDRRSEALLASKWHRLILQALEQVVSSARELESVLAQARSQDFGYGGDLSMEWMGQCLEFTSWLTTELQSITSAVAQRELAANASGKYATVGWDLAPGGPTELVVFQGDRVLIVDAENPDWAWCQTTDGEVREGWVPRNVLVIEEEKERSPSKASGGSIKSKTRHLEAKDLPPWVKKGERCKWWSTSGDRFCDVTVDAVSPETREVTIVFAVDSNCWKSLPFDHFALPAKQWLLQPHEDKVRELQAQLPTWAVPGETAFWWSASQCRALPVNVKEVCFKRRLVTVTFDSDKRARKAVPFHQLLDDPDTCLLQKTKEAHSWRPRKTSASEPDIEDADEGFASPGRSERSASIASASIASMSPGVAERRKEAEIHEKAAQQMDNIFDDMQKDLGDMLGPDAADGGMDARHIIDLSEDFAREDAQPKFSKNRSDSEQNVLKQALGFMNDRDAPEMNLAQEQHGFATIKSDGSFYHQSPHKMGSADFAVEDARGPSSATRIEGGGPAAVAMGVDDAGVAANSRNSSKGRSGAVHGGSRAPSGQGSRGGSKESGGQGQGSRGGSKESGGRGGAAGPAEGGLGGGTFGGPDMAAALGGAAEDDVFVTADAMVARRCGHAHADAVEFTNSEQDLMEQCFDRGRSDELLNEGGGHREPKEEMFSTLEKELIEELSFEQPPSPATASRAPAGEAAEGRGGRLPASPELLDDPCEEALRSLASPPQSPLNAQAARAPLAPDAQALAPPEKASRGEAARRPGALAQESEALEDPCEAALRSLASPSMLGGGRREAKAPSSDALVEEDVDVSPDPRGQGAARGHRDAFAEGGAVNEGQAAPRQKQAAWGADASGKGAAPGSAKQGAWGGAEADAHPGCAPTPLRSGGGAWAESGPGMAGAAGAGPAPAERGGAEAARASGGSGPRPQKVSWGGMDFDEAEAASPGKAKFQAEDEEEATGPDALLRQTKCLLLPETWDYEGEGALRRSPPNIASLSAAWPEVEKELESESSARLKQHGEELEKELRVAVAAIEGKLEDMQKSIEQRARAAEAKLDPTSAQKFRSMAWGVVNEAEGVKEQRRKATDARLALQKQRLSCEKDALHRSLGSEPAKVVSATFAPRASADFVELSAKEAVMEVSEATSDFYRALQVLALRPPTSFQDQQSAWLSRSGEVRRGSRESHGNALESASQAAAQALGASLEVLAARLRQAKADQKEVDKDLEKVVRGLEGLSTEERRNKQMFDGQQETEWERSHEANLKTKQMLRQKAARHGLARVDRVLQHRWQTGRDKVRPQSLASLADFANAIKEAERELESERRKLLEQTEEEVRKLQSDRQNMHEQTQVLLSAAMVIRQEKGRMSEAWASSMPQKKAKLMLKSFQRVRRLNLDMKNFDCMAELKQKHSVLLYSLRMLEARLAKENPGEENSELPEGELKLTPEQQKQLQDASTAFEEQLAGDIQALRESLNAKADRDIAKMAGRLREAAQAQYGGSLSMATSAMQASVYAATLSEYTTKVLTPFAEATHRLEIEAFRHGEVAATFPPGDPSSFGPKRKRLNEGIDATLAAIGELQSRFGQQVLTLDSVVRMASQSDPEWQRVIVDTERRWEDFCDAHPSMPADGADNEGTPRSNADEEDRFKARAVDSALEIDDLEGAMPGGGATPPDSPKSRSAAARSRAAKKAAPAPASKAPLRPGAPPSRSGSSQAVPATPGKSAAPATPGKGIAANAQPADKKAMDLLAQLDALSKTMDTTLGKAGTFSRPQGAAPGRAPAPPPASRPGLPPTGPRKAF